MNATFGDRVNECWPRSHPAVRARVNALNTRLRTAGGLISMLIHPRCRHLQMDLEGVTLVPGTGDIDKKSDLELTHLSDGLGYYVEERWPIGGRGEVIQF